MAATVRILTKEQAQAGRSQRRRAPQGPKDPGAKELATRPKQHSRIYQLVVEPWIPVAGQQSIRSVLQELQANYKDTVYIPVNLVRKESAMALYEGSWHRFLILDGRVHVRKLRGAWGRNGPGYMPCDACYFRFPSGDLVPVIVGKTNASVQEFRVCHDCLAEGTLERTSGKGYIAKRAE